MIARTCTLIAALLLTGFGPLAAAEDESVLEVPLDELEVPFDLTSWTKEFPLKDKSALRLVPFPKKISDPKGGFKLKDKLVLEVPAEKAELLGGLIATEMRRAKLPVPEIRGLKTEQLGLRLSRRSADQRSREPGSRFNIFSFGAEAKPGQYALSVGPSDIMCHGRDDAGLFYAVETLCQLIRANRHGDAIPCVQIQDWPALKWRCFQDDLTRGPSSTLDTLKLHVDLGSLLKMNLFTYYMEYQYAFKKHPLIGPKDGSLTPEDLAALVEYAKPRQVDVLGNQQSFAHSTWILKHEQYAPLRETNYILCPVKEETYQFLDDLYSEVCPLLPFEMFNVCCDETVGLGTGPSKELAEEIGVGGVYVKHIRRVHDLLKDKYGKRMMMWGDIILQHPDKLDQIPKDTVMLTWGYGAAASFEHQIIPFAESGYEFFVCPGINNWNRILPDFGDTTINIRNFVRDGAKHGTIGMLNTAWEDDGEALQGYKWHGYAWGAECAWNASTTKPEDFNRRIGAVLFGEPGDHFGRAIELLAQTHRLPGMAGMNNWRFWQNDFLPRRSVSATRTSARRLLALVTPAIEHLQACRKDATVNAQLLDAFLQGAGRMELIGRRMLDGLKAAETYTRACEATDKKETLARLGEVEELVRGTRLAHAKLGEEFQRIWLSESKPYALDWTMKRYANLDQWYEDLAAKLADARKKAQAGKPLPRPETLGLALPEAFTRRTRPHNIESAPLKPDAAWSEPSATHRLGISVGSGSVDRCELPVEVDVQLPNDLAAKPLRAFCATAGEEPREILVQLDATEKPDKKRLVLLIPGQIAKGSTAAAHVYLGLAKRPKLPPCSASTATASGGMVSMENDRLRLLLGPEGAHVYRCQVKQLAARDLTSPGQTGWAGFSDTGWDHRTAANKLTCTARGPAVVRYVCTDSTGMVKTISLFGGTCWMEVVLGEPLAYYWDFDNPQNFAADGPTPGTYLFSNGTTGPVGKQADGVPAQVKQKGVFWAVKSNREAALGMATPEVAANFVVGPGTTAGGVGIEASPRASHFITYAGPAPSQPAQTMDHLRQTLDFKNQPKVTVHALQERQTE